MAEPRPGRAPPKPQTHPAIVLFVEVPLSFLVTVTACPIKRDVIAMGRHSRAFIPAHDLAPLYREAILAEMHPTVAKEVSVSCRGDESAATPGIEVRLGRSVRNLGFGAVTNRGMSYMFQLRDAVDEVIRTFVPPAEAWIEEETTPMADESTAPSGVRRLEEEHVPILAAAAQAVHHPDFVSEMVEAAPQYINDAKTFIAMFNAALSIYEQGHPHREVEPTRAQMEESRTEEAPPEQREEAL